MRTLFLKSGAVAAALFIAAQAFASQPTTVGIASAAVGDPLSHPPQANERVLRLGVDVFASERIVTKTDDRAHLVFLDGTALTIGPHSDLTIDRFVYDPVKNAGDLKVGMTKGALRFVGGAISKKNEVQIRTPTAVVGIRGGIATVSVGEAGATSATFLYGIAMTVTAQGVTQTATRHGSQIEVAAGGRPGAPFLIPAGGLRADRAFRHPHSPFKPQNGPPPPPPGAPNSPPPPGGGSAAGSAPPPQPLAIDAAMDGSRLADLNSALGPAHQHAIEPQGTTPKTVAALRTKDRGPPTSVTRAARLGNAAVVGQAAHHNDRLRIRR